MNEIDPSEFFAGGVDFTADVREEPKPAPAIKNVFEAFEDALGLPSGSTNDGLSALKAAKKQAKEFKDKSSVINNEAKQLAIREQFSAEITDDLLKTDRERIRDEAWELYQSGKEMFDMMKERFLTTVSPTDRMCTAIATMLNSMNTTLSKLLETNMKLRKEDEHYREVKEQNAPPDMTSENQSMDFTPEKMNKFIDSWTEDFEKRVAQDLQDEYNNRTLPKPESKE